MSVSPVLRLAWEEKTKEALRLYEIIKQEQQPLVDYLRSIHKLVSRDLERLKETRKQYNDVIKELSEIAPEIAAELPPGEVKFNWGYDVYDLLAIAHRYPEWTLHEYTDGTVYSEITLDFVTDAQWANFKGWFVWPE